jgi:Domain of unknown function (DUF4180)
MSDYFEATPSGPFDPTAIVTRCAESGASSLLLDEAALPAEFFDLSRGLAGELLHRLSIYRMRMAGVVPDPTAHSANFQAFVREANRGEQYRFFATRQEAIAWLESG